MSNLYASLGVSPKKKRCPPELDDEISFTPKKLRTAPPTPPATVRKKGAASSAPPLPAHLSRMHAIQTALQHALSHALATCAVSPSSDTGIVRNVLNHYSLTTYTGLTTKFDTDDLSRLCWIWEWDGKTLPDTKGKSKLEDDDNPFLEPQATPQPREWTRGSMGLVISPSTYFLKTAGKRVPAYGIGIEVEMDIDKGMGGGMAAVARWTAEAETRRGEFRRKLEKWVELHSGEKPIPNVPRAELPQLAMATKASSLTRTLASASPKGLSALSSLEPPSSPSRSPSKSPSKRSNAVREFAIPFPITPTSKASRSESKNSLPFPQTPSRHEHSDSTASLLTPKTPSNTSPTASEPSTPANQRGANASTVPQTPTTSRRQALYERIRQRSLTSTPSKPTASSLVPGGSKLTKDQMLKMGQEEMRRRCLLGRLGGVAESVWMLFSSPVGSSITPTTRKRRALPTSEVALAVVKSSPVPISSAEAYESLSILTSLCPFFLKEMNIAGEGWLEMPAPTAASATKTTEGSPSKPKTPPSPGPSIKGKDQSAEEVHTRSPRRVKREAGGLRDVREIIRKELELQD